MKTILEMDNKMLRTIIVKQNQPKVPLNCVVFWRRKLDIEIQSFFTLSIRATKETKLRALHFKLIHNIYPHNVLLQKMGIKTTNKCDNCNEIDFIEHMFVTCNRLKLYWAYVQRLIETKILNNKMTLDTPTALFGLTREAVKCSNHTLNLANYVLLLAKFSIVKSKYSLNMDPKNMFDIELSIRKEKMGIVY